MLRHIVRRLWQWVLVLAVVSIPAGGTSAQSSTALYRADEFGVFFFYDASLWQILDEEAEPGSAYVSFSDGQTVANYWAFDTAGMTPRECIGLVLDSLNTDPTMMNVEDLWAQGSPPQIRDDDTSATMTIVVTVDVAGERQKYTSDERCEELTPGQSLLYSASSVPAATFNQTQRFPNPWLLGVEFRLPSFETGPVSIPDTTGTLDFQASCDASPLPVVARNSSLTENFVIDPGAFWVEFDIGGSSPAHLAAWRYQEQLAAESFVPPDGFALFELQIEEFSPSGIAAPYDLFYQPPGAPPVFLGSYGGPCSGGGGGSPVLIDLEE